MNENKETEMLRWYYSNHTKEEQAKAICERIVFLVKRSGKGWMRGFFALLAIRNETCLDYVQALSKTIKDSQSHELFHAQLDEWICEVSVTEH